MFPSHGFLLFADEGFFILYFLYCQTTFLKLIVDRAAFHGSPVYFFSSITVLPSYTILFLYLFLVIYFSLTLDHQIFGRTRKKIKLSLPINEIELIINEESSSDYSLLKEKLEGIINGWDKGCYLWSWWCLMLHRYVSSRDLQKRMAYLFLLISHS